MTEHWTLPKIRQNIWQQLNRGIVDKRHPFRYGVIATSGIDGVNQRTVVLRKVDKTNRLLVLYTDFRSPKVREIQHDNRIAWLFYQPKSKIQIRLKGTATLLYGETINEIVWQNLPPFGKTDYLTQEPPGSVKADQNNPSTAFQKEDRPDHFCIIHTEITSIDWLQLRREGHLRAGFEWKNNEWEMCWLTP